MVLVLRCLWAALALDAHRALHPSRPSLMRGRRPGCTHLYMRLVPQEQRETNLDVRDGTPRKPGPSRFPCGGSCFIVYLQMRSVSPGGPGVSEALAGETASVLLRERVTRQNSACTWPGSMLEPVSLFPASSPSFSLSLCSLFFLFSFYLFSF